MVIVFCWVMAMGKAGRLIATSDNTDEQMQRVNRCVSDDVDEVYASAIWTGARDAGLERNV